MENKNKLLSARGIAEIAIMTAIALGLDFLQGGLWRGVFTNGGSIGLAMIPIIVLCYRRGFLAGLVSGFILSGLQLLGGLYTIPAEWYVVLAQVALDYILAYPFVALAGLFFKPFQNAKTSIEKVKWVVIGTVIGGFGKFLCHFLAGAIFWTSSCPADFGAGPIVWSIVYNGAYMLPNIVISAIVVSAIVLKAPKLFVVDNHNNLEATKTLKENN